jgi:hypothetical protein
METRLVPIEMGFAKEHQPTARIIATKANTANGVDNTRLLLSLVTVAVAVASAGFNPEWQR